MPSGNLRDLKKQREGRRDHRDRVILSNVIYHDFFLVIKS